MGVGESFRFAASGGPVRERSRGSPMTCGCGEPEAERVDGSTAPMCRSCMLGWKRSLLSGVYGDENAERLAQEWWEETFR